MKIELTKEDVGAILQDYAFISFAKLLHADRVDDLEVDIDCDYSSISKVTISKKEKPEPEESEVKPNEK